MRFCAAYSKNIFAPASATCVLIRHSFMSLRVLIFIVTAFKVHYRAMPHNRKKVFVLVP
jgi:hypothetical protein